MMDVALIASAAVGVLAPALRHLLSLGADKAVEAAGKGVTETLWEKVKGKIFGKKGAADAANEVAAAPEDKDAKEILDTHLRQILAADPELAAEVEKLLQNAGAFHQEAHLQGDGAIAQAGAGGRAVAAGKGGIAIGGDVHGGVRSGRGED
ncbi:MAG TPA: hypothetical protein VGS22_07470 [Thermoanaerobaculia bacterium]|jgi:hypothetical protein|nr:hypothetical protein [Thermoanaerobaculia bacterium]